MRTARLCVVLGLVVLLGGVIWGCGRQETQEQAGTEEVKTYSGHGRVLAVDSTGILIRHDEIPGYMAAMTMRYPVEDTTLLSSVAAGDSVSFQIRVKGYEHRLHAIQKVEAASPEESH